MKANAPEKLYIDLFKGEFNVSYSPINNSVEYTRTDAFLKKACAWLKENYKDYIIVDIDNKYEGIDGLFLKDFINYMEGE